VLRQKWPARWCGRLGGALRYSFHEFINTVVIIKKYLSYLFYRTFALLFVSVLRLIIGTYIVMV
jgi:hypothetical protein